VCLYTTLECLWPHKIQLYLSKVQPLDKLKGSHNFMVMALCHSVTRALRDTHLPLYVSIFLTGSFLLQSTCSKSLDGSFNIVCYTNDM
jgi:hypothetical protein